MYTELRPIQQANHSEATNPSYWSDLFENSPRFSLSKAVTLRLDKRFALIKQHFKPNGRILDAGCGTGDWVLFLNSVNFRAEGLDYSSQLIDGLKTKYAHVPWSQGRIQEIPLAANSFDGLISWGVIEHDKHGPDAALKEFFRILKPGGKIVVTVPVENRLTVASSKAQFTERDLRENSGFFQFFMSEQELQYFVEVAGFKSLQTGPLGAASLAILFPKAYSKMLKTPRLLWVTNQFVKLLFFWRGAHNMIYCVAAKP